MNLTERDRLQPEQITHCLQNRPLPLDLARHPGASNADNPAASTKEADHADGDSQSAQLSLQVPLQLRVLDEVPSTNRHLWDWIDQGAFVGAVVIAAQQTAGKGQWGRHWRSPLGGLYLSLAIAPQCPLDQVGQLTICSAWGVASALRWHHIPVQLKWPNDLILQGRKLGGILIETRMQQGLIPWAVIGIGINWANPVPELGIALQAYIGDEQCPLQSINELAAAVIQGAMAGYRSWQTHGIAAILPGYEALLTHMGQNVQVAEGMGQVVGVTETGNLRVALSASVAESAAASAAETQFKPGEIRLGYR